MPNMNSQVSAHTLMVTLKSRFGDDCQAISSEIWQVERDAFQLRAQLLHTQSWLRLQISIAPVPEVQSFLAQILQANYDDTQEARYAIADDILWAVFYRDLTSLTTEQLETAIDRLLLLQQQGAGIFFSRFIEAQVRQIIMVAKLRGQSMEATLQTIDRFYSEGMMGDMDASGYQDNALKAWQYQLKRLWPEVEVPQRDGES